MLIVATRVRYEFCYSQQSRSPLSVDLTLIFKMAADDVEEQKQTQCFEMFMALTNYKRLHIAIVFHRFQFGFYR